MTWTDAELKKVRDRSDPGLMTEFMNTYTFTAREIASYPYKQRRTFLLDLPNSDKQVKFYAADEENAAKWVAKEYEVDYPVVLLEEITTYTEVVINL